MIQSLFVWTCSLLFALLVLGCYSTLEFDTTVRAMMVRHTTQSILVASLATYSYSQQVLDLSTVAWTVTSPNFTYLSVPGKIPSQAHLDLYAAQVIGDPLFGLNDFNLRWIGDSNWTYTSDSLESL